MVFRKFLDLSYSSYGEANDLDRFSLSHIKDLSVTMQKRKQLKQI